MLVAMRFPSQNAKSAEANQAASPQESRKHQPEDLDGTIANRHYNTSSQLQIGDGAFHGSSCVRIRPQELS